MRLAVEDRERRSTQCVQRNSESRDKNFRRIKALGFQIVRLEGMSSGTGYVLLCAFCKKEIRRSAFELLRNAHRTPLCLDCAAKSRPVKLQSFESAWNQLRKRAKTLNVPFKLSLSELVETLGSQPRCHYCHVSLRIDPRSPVSHLDRKNNALGYTKDNCVACCWDCNRIKSDVFSFEEMELLGTTLSVLGQSRRQRVRITNNGRVSVHKKGRNALVPRSSLSQYQSQGWKLGQIRRRR